LYSSVRYNEPRGVGSSNMTREEPCGIACKSGARWHLADR
jgi:hypothetical protein